MFGGHGIFRDGLMIAIAADDALWMKTDAESRAAFDIAGSRPFSFAKSDGSVTVLSYWSLPDEALDDPDSMRHWVRLAESAARRASLAAGSRKAARSGDFLAPKGLRTRTSGAIRATPAAKPPDKQAPVAQLDRAPDYESGGQRFESFRARQFLV